jgi:hypothetical protein
MYSHPRYGELSETTILERIRECYELPQSNYTHDLYNHRRGHLSRVINLNGSGHPCLCDSPNYVKTLLFHSAFDCGIPAVEMLFNITRECPQSVYSCMANNFYIINAILGNFQYGIPPTFTLMPAKEMMRRACMIGLKPAYSFLRAIASTFIMCSCAKDRFRDVCDFVFEDGFIPSETSWRGHEENCECVYYRVADIAECIVYASRILICETYNDYIRNQTLFDIINKRINPK